MGLPGAYGQIGVVRGGGGWIRTNEGNASDFTDRPVWPLRYPSGRSGKTGVEPIIATAEALGQRGPTGLLFVCENVLP